MDLWSAIKAFALLKSGEVAAHLRDFDPVTSTYIEIASGTLSVADWQGGSTTWVNKTITINVSSYTLAAGHQLELKLTVGASSQDDLWFAYDTTAYPSKLTLP